MAGFDPRAAKLLQPGEHVTIGGCPGLRLVASVGRKTWTYRYKGGDGRMKQVAVGHWPAMSLADATAEWSALRDQRAAGVDIKAQRKASAISTPTPDEYTVRDLVQDYIDGPLREGRKDAGFLAASRALQRLLDDFSDTASRPAVLTDRGVAFAMIESRKPTPTMATKLRAMLGAAWDHALDAGKLPANTPNWWRQVHRGKLKSKGKIVQGQHVGRQRRVLSGAEVAALLEWLPNMHELGRDVTTMYLWTCARGAEIVSLRANHISQEADGWWATVPKASTKTAHVDGAVDLRVPLVGRALEIVQRRLATLGPSGWLFEDVRGEQYTQHDYSSYIYHLQPDSAKARRRQGAGLVLPVTGWSAHNLRRTARTMLSAIGCIDEIAEAIVGHVPAQIVATYNAHSYDAERRLWLQRLADHLESLAATSGGLPARP